MRRTPAKVNLYLTVGDLRPSDGRHNIQTIFYPYWRVTDQLAVSPNPVGKGMTLELSGRIIPGGGNPQENLACHAVEAYCRKFDIPADFHITLQKAIPVGGGMGGGSSDAGAALLEVNDLMRLATPQELHDIAAELGADVPLFLNPVPSLATGIGDILTPMDDFPELQLLAIYPGFASPVAWAYKNWKRPADAAPMPFPLAVNTNWADYLWNDLGFAVEEKYPPIHDAIVALKNHGARNAIVSGSGSSVFGIFDSAEERDQAKTALSRDWETI